MTGPQRIDTVIVGGGQAGLSLSYYLAQQGREHVILEQAAQLADPWRNQRWDSFTLLTPNWHLRLPGFPYQGNDPDGFMPRAEVVAYLENYAAYIHAPVRLGVRVISAEPAAGGKGYLVQTGDGAYSAQNVVVATGTFQKPKIPAFSANLPGRVRQLHSSEYRNPGALPPGAVLVVGSAQSGCQIGEELYQSGRKVYLCVGTAPRVPRRYRGKDITWWLDKNGFFSRTVDMLPSPKARFIGNPQVSGKDGGRNLNLHQFARDGVTLLGRLVGAQDGKIILAPDLNENLAKTDKAEADLLKSIDSYIEKNGLDAPPEEVPILHDGYQAEVVTELDVQAAGITTVIWAMGYKFDFGWVRLDTFDADGYPLQQRGVTRYPGLYFVGQHWLHMPRSGLFLGVGDDAAHVANHIAGGGS